ncbi:CHAT domain-containing tetratricopeptide repeat protein [Microbacterium sp. BK668]|uniref:CHAT domain-containing tetratricopeptide repeat protein n=1 Tax=Microbacterium sp. BK668 TaxID=2512118 RepID=UPI00105D86B2|nr:CHAT domain-containing tetratricopeptide repeat protein [Microbacterium sp. BK668]TDN93257.1 CHAT domain-containing protein [Microbacterium sp. BK668]
MAEERHPVEPPTIAEVVLRWAEGSAPLGIGPDVTGSTGPALASIPRACAGLVAVDHLEGFADAVEADDPAARAAMPGFIVAANRLVREAMAEVSRLVSAKEHRPVTRLGVATAQLLVDLGGPEAYPDAAIQLRWAASSYYALGDLRRCIAAYGSAIELLEQCRPAMDELLSTCHDNRGLALFSLGEVDDGIADVIAARDVEQQRARHLRTSEEREASAAHLAAIESNLGGAYGEAGEYGLAAAAYVRSLEILEGLPEALAGERTGFVLDNLALTYTSLGRLDDALQTYERARGYLRDSPPAVRKVNADGRALAHSRKGDAEAAAAVFEEILALAEEDVRARISPEVFAASLDRAVENLVPADSEAWRARVAAVEYAEAGDDDRAEEQYRRAASLAREAGDRLTQLVCLAAGAAVIIHRDQRAALSAASEVRQVALAEGLATPVVLANAAASALLASGVEPVDRNTDLVTVSLESRFLIDLLAEQMESYPEEIRARLTGADPGVLAQRLGTAAMRSLAYARATEYLFESLQFAIALGREESIVIRLDRLRRALVAGKRDPDLLHVVLERLREFADTAARDDVRLRALLSLGEHEAYNGEPSRAVADLRAAVEPLERVRSARGAAASDLDRFDSVNQLYPVLVEALLESDGSDAPAQEAYEHLQVARARTVMESLHAQVGAAGAYTPPKLEETVALLAGLPRPTAAVEILVRQSGLTALIVQAGGVARVDASGDPDSLWTVMAGDVRERAAETVELVRTSTLLRDLVKRVESALAPGVAVLLSVDDGLANLPFHAVALGGGYWSDVRSIGRIPAIAMLRYAPRERPAHVSVVAGDSAGDLPGAAQECAHVGDVLQARPLLRDDCTLDAFAAAIRGKDVEIVHLAVHGRADARRGGRAGLLFAGNEGGAQWARFDDLAVLPWRARLIVFSGCSTAVGGPRDGRGLYGIAQLATRAGALSTIASLWPVNDRSAAVFMIEFYSALSRARDGQDQVDLRAVMDAARSGLRRWLSGEPASQASSDIGRPVGDATAHARDGRDLTPVDSQLGIPVTVREPETRDLLHWAPFVLIGDPVLRFSG